MEDVGWAVLSVLMGVAFALQSALMGAAGRDRGPVEAVYVSLTLTIAGIAVALLLLQTGLRDVQLPGPLRDPWLPLAVLGATGAAFAVSMRGLRPIYGLMGVLGMVFMLGSPVLVPEVGVALFVAASTTGSLISALIIDHWGWLDSDIRRVTPTRVAGVVLLVAGVVLIAG